jgi:hypothetical protein
MNVFLGKSEKFLHLGIKPPLTIEQCGIINNYSDISGAFKMRSMPAGEEYIETNFSFDPDGLTHEEVEGLRAVARQIAAVLRMSGEEVKLDEKVYLLNNGKFPSEDTELPIK